QCRQKAACLSCELWCDQITESQEVEPQRRLLQKHGSGVRLGIGRLQQALQKEQQAGLIGNQRVERYWGRLGEWALRAAKERRHITPGLQVARLAVEQVERHPLTHQMALGKGHVALLRIALE